jgi:ketosteroid isomerase-like protein
MSASVDTVRRIYAEGLSEAHAGPKFDALLALCDPDIELVNPADAVEPGTRRGLKGIRDAMNSLSDTFSWSQHTVHALYDGGDTVVASIRFRARGRGSGAEIEHDEAHTWTFRDNLIVRYEWGRDLEQALAAAGLTPAAAVELD